jgi:hypothetical protein
MNITITIMEDYYIDIRIIRPDGTLDPDTRAYLGPFEYHGIAVTNASELSIFFSRIGWQVQVSEEKTA